MLWRDQCVDSVDRYVPKQEFGECARDLLRVALVDEQAVEFEAGPDLGPEIETDPIVMCAGNRKLGPILDCRDLDRYRWIGEERPLYVIRKIRLKWVWDFRPLVDEQ